MFQFTFKTTPDEAQFSRAFSRFGDNITDFTKPFERIADNFYEGEREIFGSGGGAAGGWAPLSPQYAAWKSLHYPGRPILQRTGAMMESFTGKSGPFSRFSLAPKRLEMGADDPKAGYHQKGGGNLPKREVVKLKEQQKREWMKYVHEHAVHSWPGIGGRDWAEIRTADVHFGGI